jgi:hypothetical protein
MTKQNKHYLIDLQQEVGLRYELLRIRESVHSAKGRLRYDLVDAFDTEKKKVVILRISDDSRITGVVKCS